MINRIYIATVLTCFNFIAVFCSSCAVTLENCTDTECIEKAVEISLNKENRDTLPFIDKGCKLMGSQRCLVIAHENDNNREIHYQIIFATCKYSKEICLSQLTGEDIAFYIKSSRILDRNLIFLDETKSHIMFALNAMWPSTYSYPSLSVEAIRDQCIMNGSMPACLYYAARNGLEKDENANSAALDSKLKILANLTNTINKDCMSHSTFAGFNACTIANEFKHEFGELAKAMQEQFVKLLDSEKQKELELEKQRQMAIVEKERQREEQECLDKYDCAVKLCNEKNEKACHALFVRYPSAQICKKLKDNDKCRYEQAVNAYKSRKCLSNYYLVWIDIVQKISDRKYFGYFSDVDGHQKTAAIITLDPQIKKVFKSVGRVPAWPNMGIRMAGETVVTLESGFKEKAVITTIGDKQCAQGFADIMKLKGVSYAH